MFMQINNHIYTLIYVYTCIYVFTLVYIYTYIYVYTCNIGAKLCNGLWGIRNKLEPLKLLLGTRKHNFAKIKGLSISNLYIDYSKKIRILSEFLHTQNISKKNCRPMLRHPIVECLENK